MDPAREEFIKYKQLILEKLDSISVASAKDSNHYEAELSNGLFTAATAFLALVLAFMGNIKGSNVFSNAGWLFVVSVIFFALSLIPWLIDYILAIHLFQKSLKMCRKYREHVREADNMSTLRTIEIVELESMNDKKNTSSSIAPRILQIILFVLGLLFSSVTIVICILA